MEREFPWGGGSGGGSFMSGVVSRSVPKQEDTEFQRERKAGVCFPEGTLREEVGFNEKTHPIVPVESVQWLQVTSDPPDFSPLPCKVLNCGVFPKINAVQSLWQGGKFQIVCV